MTEVRSPRRWLLRLTQASPLITIALFAAVWFSVPGYFAMQLMATAVPIDGVQVTPEMRSQWVGLEAQSQAAMDAGLTGSEDSLQSAVEDTYAELVDRQAEYVTTESVKALPFDPGDPAYQRLVEWEARTGAEVWAWVLLPVDSSSVIASAIGDKKSFDAVKSEIDSRPDDGVYETAQPTTVLESYTLNQGPMGAMQPLNPTVFSIGEQGGSGSDAYMFSSASILAGGEVWQVVTLSTQEGPDGGPVAMPSDLKGVDPRGVGYDALLKRVAVRENMNIWVSGPLDARAVPLRVPGSDTASDSVRLAGLVWPDVYSGAQAAYIAVPTALPAEAREIAGGSAGVVMPMSLWTSDVGGPWNWGPDEIAPQTVAFLAVFDEIPGGRPGLPDRAWLVWQRFVSGYFPWLVGACIGLLALSLVASPSAFVIERRRRAKERVRDELARMQRDAHDKVYNRLSALSKRVAAAGDQAQADVSRSLSGIADDIRGTVGELQDILGDQVHRADGALTTLPLAVQLESVCAAQAARLGVQVECELASNLPLVSPRLGWDLQCMAEEAITNAVRHGNAGSVRVTVALDVPGVLRMTVADDGDGSVVASPDAAHPQSTGLRGMRDRLTSYGGTIEIMVGDQGTRLIISIPLVDDDGGAS